MSDDANAPKRSLKMVTVYLRPEQLQELQAESARLKVPVAMLIRFGAKLALKRLKSAPGPGLAGLNADG